MTNLLNNLVYPVLVMVVGGVLYGYLLKRLRKRELSFFGTPSIVDYDQYSGKWNSIHITKNRVGKPTFSYHHYKIRVNKRGRITGEMKDTVDDQEVHSYTIKGRILPGRIIMWSVSTIDSSIYGCEVYYTPYNPKEMSGFVTASNYYQAEPFVSPIFASTDSVNEEYFRDRVKESESKFYSSLD